MVSLSILFITFFLAYSLSQNFQKRSNQLYKDINNVITKKNYDGSGGTRLALNIVGVHTFIDYPFLGTGIDYKMKDIKKYAKQNNFNAEALQSFADYHNGFLTIIVQLGIIGFITVFLIIYSLLSFKYKTREYSLESKLFAVTFILFSITHNTFHTMNPMIFFALFAGYFNALSQSKV
jgi:O-antigen ligase